MDELKSIRNKGESGQYDYYTIPMLTKLFFKEILPLILSRLDSIEHVLINNSNCARSWIKDDRKAGMSQHTKE